MFRSLVSELAIAQCLYDEDGQMRLQQIDQASEHQGADDHGRHHHLEDGDVQQKGGHLHLNLKMFTL